MIDFNGLETWWIISVSRTWTAKESHTTGMATSRTPIIKIPSAIIYIVCQKGVVCYEREGGKGFAIICMAHLGNLTNQL